MIIEFYGKECPHCEKMNEVVNKLKQEGFEIEQLEVWHDKENMKYAEECDKIAKCGGVPFFFNTENEKFLCGEASQEELKSWITGE